MAAVTTTTEQSTAVMSLDQLGREAAARLKTAERYTNRYIDLYISAGKMLIEARQVCRAQDIAWNKWLSDYGMDRMRAHIAIARAGGDAAMEGQGAKPGGIKAKSEDELRERRKAYDRTYRQKQRQRLLAPPPEVYLARDTPPHDQAVAIRQSMLTKIADHFAKQPDDYLSKFIKEHIQ